MQKLDSFLHQAAFKQRTRKLSLYVDSDNGGSDDEVEIGAPLGVSNLCPVVKIQPDPVLIRNAVGPFLPGKSDTNPQDTEEEDYAGNQLEDDEWDGFGKHHGIRGEGRATKDINYVDDNAPGVEEEEGNEVALVNASIGSSRSFFFLLKGLRRSPKRHERTILTDFMTGLKKMGELSVR